ncbi:glutamine--fructose-6-phosphate transaminase (isomerizing) [Candidatus Pandoraea novymonadis]|uniref:Glutamine--fructose-6-phosphate aminotransferase [isomerizing] n=1 Tax=Candidatus Pandoraea novymonadis TaxID=1808959 RepID=A0ABX5FD24_9BURK|nr:glutamine--fructose-6-phosphate transaminase (isomerizing) [Candidatus Pandoraea novymonadis]PSB91619.1 isomerizing glutamine-fructose-6-phosphate aminotransferase [Candidatus Pandoraea novymonadis]
MCGIVGAVAKRNVVSILMEGLRRLEYRGYDSCGIAVLKDGALHRARSVSRVIDLATQVEATAISSDMGIAHTRWATHGEPVVVNAHPIFSCDELTIVHNGIIENHESLREELSSQGYEFFSQTDTEVIAHLIHALLQSGVAEDLFKAVRLATKRLDGAYAIAVFRKQEPHLMVGARAGSPLIVGFGDGENFLASDALALAGTTDKFAYLEEGDVVALTRDSVTIINRKDISVERQVRRVHAYSGAIDLGQYRHYMQKEIIEQPHAIADTMEGVSGIVPELFGYEAEHIFKHINSILILACGTSYYAGLTAKHWLESLAKIPTSVEVASEYRYRQSVPNPRSLVVTISQSGETADTIVALQYAKALGQKHTLAICNVSTSAMVGQTTLHYLTRAGVEIGVASTKAFTTQLTALFLLTLTLAKLRNRLSTAEEDAYLKQLRHLPMALYSVLALEPQIIAWSDDFAKCEHALFLGRGLHYPIALEGALKLKEVSYIHAEAYPAGELKHGPLALVTDKMPVVTIAPNDALVEKLKSNIQEVRTRGGRLYVFADADSNIQHDDGVHVIRMPEHYGQLSPILHTVPLQLLAYHTACARGTDVDKPRNLAKSVTVE